MGLFTWLFGSQADDIDAEFDAFDDELPIVSRAESEAAMDVALQVANPNDAEAVNAAYFAALRQMRQQ